MVVPEVPEANPMEPVQRECLVVQGQPELAVPLLGQAIQFQVGEIKRMEFSLQIVASTHCKLQMNHYVQ